MASTLPEVPGFLLPTSSQTSLLPESEVVRVVTGPSHSSLPVALGVSALGENAGRSREGISFDSPLGPPQAGTEQVFPMRHGGAGTWSKGAARNLLLAGPVAWAALR